VNHSIANKLSRKRAIEQNCRDCICDPANAGTWRQQVTLCAVHECALWHWRPVSASDIPEPLLDAYGVSDGEKSLFRGPKRDFFSGTEAVREARTLAGNKT